jgi:hypothetical protein
MNTRQPLALAAAVAAALVIPSTGCHRGDKTTPVSETQTQTPARVENRPLTVTGCLRAGEAADTFVLTTGGTDAATYNLVAREGVNLADHVGSQVEVDGILTAQQETASRAETPADTDKGKKATGTAGTPSVATVTSVDIRRLEVNAIHHTGKDCR